MSQNLVNYFQLAGIWSGLKKELKIAIAMDGRDAL
jgi:hypothetical protein